jgi:hypothetical protein
VNAIDEKARAAADRAVRKVSTEPVTYRRQQAAPYDPDTRTAPAGFSETKVYGFMESGIAHFDKGGIEAGENEFTTPALQMDFTPTVGDQLVIDGETWTVKEVKQAFCIAAPILWHLRVKRG